MTAIINTIWGGKVCQIVDRQISRGKTEVVDPVSNKICIILTKDALATIAYTGIAVANETWLDCNIANCLAHRKLAFSVCSPGAPLLCRPINTVVSELAANLNGLLNRDKIAREYDLKLSIVGWHLNNVNSPFSWELYRGPRESNGNRYFKLKRHQTGKFFRQHPKGLWGETLGDTGKLIDNELISIGNSEGMTHDNVERHLRNAIVARSSETITVSSDCVAVQLDPLNPAGQVQFTFYPGSDGESRKFLCPWVLTPRLICSPTESTSAYCTESECGNYVLSGFSDTNTNLNISTRLPIRFREPSDGRISFNFQDRIKPSG